LVRPVDKTVLVWNDEIIGISQYIKRVANETLKSASGRNVAGIEAKDKETFNNALDLIKNKINNAEEGYFPATHNDVQYVAVLADLTHPEVVEPHEEPGEA
jgi:uncharacterized protein YpuA (DUF1002 family)